jgi:hypothetical protein
MKNVYLAFSIFIIMIIGIFFSIIVINRSCDHLQNLNSTLESYILKENYKAAYNLSLDYIDQWKSDSKFLTLYIHHEDLDHVDNEVLKLTQYIKIRDRSEALATVHAMKYLIDHIKSNEKVSISNIF